MFMSEIGCNHQLRSEYYIKSVITILLLSGLLLPQSQPTKTNEIPCAGFLPNSKAAIRAAEAALTPIYGLNTVKANKPFSAKLNQGVWIVRGKPIRRSESDMIAKISKKTGLPPLVYRWRVIWALSFSHALERTVFRRAGAPVRFTSAG